MNPREITRYAAACLHRALKEADAFAAARRCLQLQSIERGGDGTLRDVQAHLVEDGETVVLYADWKDDEPMMASFKLANRTEDSEFDAEWYCERLCAARR
jgi:hypothetical protein